MKTDKLIDAMQYLDDDILDEVDAARSGQAPQKKIIPWTRIAKWGSIAAAAAIVLLVSANAMLNRGDTRSAEVAMDMAEQGQTVENEEINQAEAEHQDLGQKEASDEFSASGFDGSSDVAENAGAQEDISQDGKTDEGVYCIGVSLYKETADTVYYTCSEAAEGADFGQGDLVAVNREELMKLYAMVDVEYLVFSGCEYKEEDEAYHISLCQK